MLIYQGVVTAILAALLLNTLNNLRLIRRPLIRPAPESGPLVSILVPARNEARTIARCVVSLARQDYPHCEVLVLDDQSKDETAAIVERVARRHTWVRLLRGAALPPGWHGKAWACRQLAQAARGDWLLFVDADTVLARECVTAVLGAARERQADLLTLMPRLEAGGMGEALLLATMPLTFAGFLPQGLVMGRRWPLVAGALGKFLLFRRETYLRIGGHAAVRTDIVEDMQLSRLVKQHGGRLLWSDGTALVRARPYRGLGEAWSGIAKSSFAAIDYSLAALALGIPAAAVLLAPYGFAIAGVVNRRADVVLLWLPLAQVALLWVSYLLLLWRFQLPRRIVVLHAATILATILLTLQSAYQVTLGDGVAWKGRTYHFGGAGPRAGRRVGVAVELPAARLAIAVLLLPLGWHWGRAGLPLAAILTLVAGTCAVMEYSGARERAGRLTSVADICWCAAGLAYLQLDGLLPIGLVLAALVVPALVAWMASWRAGVVTAGALLGTSIVLAAGMAAPGLDTIGVVWVVGVAVLARRSIAHMVEPWLQRFRSP
ncbi:MAG TPA: glycosyltransferase [Ktedonobacterales bacterium]|nr:glycosyltransferase [Ktedonobacterales bacterium]